MRFDWDPFPDKLTMLGGGDYEPRLGGQVFVRGKLGFSMVVEFIQIIAPYRVAIKMIQGPVFLKLFAGTWIFYKVNDNETLAEFSYTIKVKPLSLLKRNNNNDINNTGFINGCLEKIINAYFSNMTHKRLIGLKTYCEKNKNK